MAIFDELKFVGKTLQEAGKIDLYSKILDIQERLLEMQNIIMNLENENKKLKEKLENKESVIFDKNAYWINQKNGDGKDGPYCSCCWDDDKKLIRMQPCANSAYFTCHKCKNSVQIYLDKNILNIDESESFDPYSIF